MYVRRVHNGPWPFAKVGLHAAAYISRLSMFGRHRTWDLDEREPIFEREFFSEMSDRAHEVISCGGPGASLESLCANWCRKHDLKDGLSEGIRYTSM